MSVLGPHLVQPLLHLFNRDLSRVDSSQVLQPWNRPQENSSRCVADQNFRALFYHILSSLLYWNRDLSLSGDEDHVVRHLRQLVLQRIVVKAGGSTRQDGATIRTAGGRVANPKPGVALDLPRNSLSGVFEVCIRKPDKATKLVVALIVVVHWKFTPYPERAYGGTLENRCI